MDTVALEAAPGPGCWWTCWDVCMFAGANWFQADNVVWWSLPY